MITLAPGGWRVGNRQPPGRRGRSERGGTVEIGLGETAKITETSAGGVVEALVGTITVNGTEVAPGSPVTVGTTTTGTLSRIRLAITRVPRQPAHRAFALTATFTQGAGSNGIAPLAEPVQLRIGTYTVTVPRGSFQRDSRGRFWFRRRIEGVALTALIRPLGGGLGLALATLPMARD